MSKDAGDLNLRLQMELGALKEENLNVLKKNDQIKREMQALEAKLQVHKLYGHFFRANLFPAIFNFNDFYFIL